MSWELLPEEIQVLILSKLPYSSLEMCRRVSKSVRRTVETNKGRLARRRIDLVRLSREDGEWEVSMHSREGRKRRVIREEQTTNKRPRTDSDEERAATSPSEQTLLELGQLTTESSVGTLEFYEVSLTPSVIEALLNTLKGVSVDSIEISMCSFDSMESDNLLRLLSHYNPRIVRLSWLRRLEPEFFHHDELMNFLKGRESLELVHLTDREGKGVTVPLRIEELIAKGCYSFHVDQSSAITKEGIALLITAMTGGTIPHQARLECPIRPDMPKDSQLRYRRDKAGFFISRTTK